MMNRTLGQAIRDMRQSRGWSQQELADRAGLCESTVYRAELETVRPKAASLEALFTAFGPDVLAAWHEDPEFYKGPVRGLTWADDDEPVPSWILWIDEKEDAIEPETI